MQKPLDANSSMIFSYAVFYTKNVLTVAIFTVRTAEDDHIASPRLASKAEKRQKILLGFVVVNRDPAGFA